MRVKSIKNIDGFFRALEKCHGRVELITQYIGLTRVFSNPDIESYEIVCYDAEDYALLKEFLVPVK